MSIEHPIYFAAGDAGGGPEQNNKQKPLEKKEIKIDLNKIDPNNFNEEEIEKIFKDQKTTETPQEKTPEPEQEQKSEQPQQAPEEKNKKQNEQDKQYLTEQLGADIKFFTENPTPEELNAWQERIKNDFNEFPKEKQDTVMTSLNKELDETMREIERIENNSQDSLESQDSVKVLEYLQNWQKAIKSRIEVYDTVLKSQKPLEKTPEKPLEKEKAEKIKKHFQEELKKVEDLPQETEIKKWRKTNECLRLLDDWVPFGHLDNFEGLDKLMDTLEGSKPKLRISYPLIQENASRKIALEMSFQYKLWGASDQDKISKINYFIDKWLKNKSRYYQRGEEFKNYVLKPPEKYLEQRAEKGYVIGEPLKEELEQKPDKISQWSIEQTSENLKLLGQRDRTLNQISQILALQNVPYSHGIDQLISNIENKNVQFNSLTEVRKIEEWQDETKIKYLMNFKAGLGTLPSMPLKVEYYEKLIEAKAKNLKPEDKAILMAVLEGYETGIKDKKGKERLEQLKNKISGLVEKEKETPKSKVIKDAVELIKKEEKKGKESLFQKMGGWNTVGGVAGFSLMMFLILIFLGEFELVKKAAGIGGGGEEKKEKKK